jgi:uncharacterized protein
MALATSTPPSSLPEQRLRHHLRQYSSIAIALSGGVDSTLLTLLAHQELPFGTVHAITGISSSLPANSLDAIKAFCKNHRISIHFVHTDELNKLSYVRNSPDRCYHCKDELYDKLQEQAARLGAEIVLDGTHGDDLKGHRPGHRAAIEWGIKSPFVELGIVKSTIRQLAHSLGLTNAAAPSSPCLSSRVAYGIPVTPERLKRIERSENFLCSLGFPKVRVRLHGPTARIEVPAADLSRLANQHRTIAQKLKSYGFTYVTLDLQGYRSGSLLEIIETDASA